MNGKSWKVYVHINKQNNKRYVGVTSKAKVEHRWNHGNGYNQNPRFFSAIKHYGWDNFYHIVLFENLTEKEAMDMERLLIRFWRTMECDYGYNLTSGGEGSPNTTVSAETRMKLSIARRKENLSEETLRRRSESLRGRKFSDSHKDKIGIANSKSIAMLDSENNIIRIFKSARDAEVELHISHSHISQCCHGKRNTAGGYGWKFAQAV